ncbi:3-hydroxyacyl-ACP dehydratase FabZ family protein [Pseudoalteromonas ostreae]|uniref:3-hydroxyacyl-ACP dehydratase FabZ family protein n=1 Tax=Pseudoalteromonas ostreae TaxID=2774154 RepID=UPI001B3736E6|nr:3-hydroxyacyl-ACP dehydratase FabZ family protein [Pseudoalteromonas ostreae]
MNIEYNQLIDRIVEHNGLDTIICESEVPDRAPIFEGHFPGNPIVPGVILIEMMAQAGGYIHMLSKDFEEMAYLATVRSAKFRNFVTPNQVLTIKSKITHHGGGYLICKAKISDAAGGVVADSELMLKLQNFANEKMREYIKNIALQAGWNGHDL